MDDTERLHQILTELQWCRDSINRLQSNANSEREVRKDAHVEIYKKIDKVETDLRNIIYGNGKLGIIIEIDRLKEFKKAFYWVTAVVVGILVKMLIDFIVAT